MPKTEEQLPRRDAHVPGDGVPARRGMPHLAAEGVRGDQVDAPEQARPAVAGARIRWERPAPATGSATRTRGCSRSPRHHDPSPSGFDLRRRSYVHAPRRYGEEGERGNQCLRRGGSPASHGGVHATTRCGRY
ncbi:hypothetical protein PAHAL_5G066800 [Panicum hallii]|uniref:Uncharacterized protein n=1 Tax=Panicum hallii TaxID=206008 RepID=A0A2T8IJ80_9POAL|nr:hypothetical protein PAHAL_5G066800 [Panicum hallii]